MPGNYPIGTPSNFPQGFANGISIRGVPLLQAQPGNVYWVDNDSSLNPGQHAGSDSNRGTFLDPFATLNKALSVCQGGRGDIIMIGAGHTEQISSSTAFYASTSDVAIIGMGAGSSRPTFILDTATTSTLNITGANISFQNCQFIGNFLNVATLFTLSNAQFTANVVAGSSLLNVTAVSSGSIYQGNTVFGSGVGLSNANGTPCILNQVSGTPNGVGVYQLDTTFVSAVASGTFYTSTKNFSVDNCDIKDTSATLNILNLFTLSTIANASDGLQITRNMISSLATSGAVNLLNYQAAQDRVRIDGNIYTALTTNSGAVIVGGSNNLTNFLLLNNTFVLTNAAATATAYLLTTSGTSCTGFINNNYDFCLANTTYNNSLKVTAGSGLRFGSNWHARTADKSAGLVLPTADS